MLSPEREKFIRTYLEERKFGSDCPHHKMLNDVILEIDTIRFENEKMKLHLNAIQSHFSIGVKALEKIDSLGCIASKKGDREDEWLRHLGAQSKMIAQEALLKLRGGE